MADSPKPMSELERQLQLLSARFGERLQQELPELAERAGQLLLSSDPDDQRQRLSSLREQLHKLAGAAGTFGFARLGERARELEQQALHWLDSLQDQTKGLYSFIHELQQFGQQSLQSEPRPNCPGRPRNVDKPLSDAHCIYILEDQPDIGENMRLTLGNFGYAAEHFSCTAELDQALQRRLPDALIVDVNLGGDAQNGLAYAAALQQRLAQPLPLLVITNQDDFATHLQAVRIGAMGFFTKPVDIPQLENRLERCFAQQNGEPFRVLVVDDDQDLASHYSLILRGANMLVEKLQDPQDIFSCMSRFNPEVVLLDVNMPGCSGPELAQIIRFNDDWLRVPIIYLSAETNISRQMDALLKAGDDFLTKPIADNALVTAVFSRAQRARLLSNALARDSLTGLLKHADIKEQVGIELERAQRSGKPASVAMLDIDHFKRVNDSYGHTTGDNVIRALANLLRQRLRRVDSLGRYGGEEFLAVLPDCPPEQALRILDEIRQRFAELRFIAAGSEFSVTLSAGLSSTRQNSSAGELLERADRALYAAKHGGRNNVRLAD